MSRSRRWGPYSNEGLQRTDYGPDGPVISLLKRPVRSERSRVCVKERIPEILVYMQESVSRDITVEGAANRFGYSKYHFNREFKQLTGFSAADYLPGQTPQAGSSINLMIVV